ncbi:glycosyltransferase family 4 protein [Candidatus Magnetaquicoccus inordinatus]|uniref:glycosyltransferase family 4 protein n=1 Tax=Candidatus Magnetaquicoccus inordinatus TaxID=2496818 RepID=UPI00187D0DAB|nr:glycosyltransferase family 4 protein [Candidatus Magnetaquicoccus inordinatus]
MKHSGTILFINRFYAPDYFAATSRLLTDLTADLAAAGHDVQVITSRLRYDTTQTPLSMRQRMAGVEVHRVWTTRFGRFSLYGRSIDYLTFHLSAMWRLLCLAKAGDLVVVMTDPPLLSLSLWPVIALRRCHLISWNQDLFPETAGALLPFPVGSRWLLSLLRRLRNFSLRHARRAVVLGKRMAERLLAEGIAADKVCIIPNWEDGQCIMPLATAENPLRAEWQLVDRFVVAYVGNLGRAHELDTVLAAAEYLTDRPDICFLFVGGGAGLPRLQAWQQQHPHAHLLIQPYQSRERLLYTMGVADVHWFSLLPALEGLIVPSKFYGIAAAGRATLFIGDSNGEIPALLQAGNCGESFAVGAAREVAERIRHWADHPALCRKMGERARQWFLQNHDQALAMRLWRQLIEEVVQEINTHA